MKTKNEYLGEFNLDSCGRITNLGKFQGSHLYAVYFYELLLDSEQDADIEGIALFNICPQDIKLFPELKGCQVASIFIDDSGFVYCNLWNENIDKISQYILNTNSI